MTWQRARRPEQKEQRRAAILGAAAALFEQDGLEGASLNAIAREAGISKANIYRYFESREAIFLHLLLDDYEEWIADVEQGLAPLAGSDEEGLVARVVVASIAARPRLAALAASVSSVLERNVTVEAVVRFKTAYLGLALRLANAVKVSMPSLSMEGIRQLLTTSQALLVGMWPSANPPPAVAEALERPELQLACIDFERDFEAALVTFLRGLKAEAS